MPKLRVGVVYGGPSSEHAISVASGKSILKHIDKEKYDAVDMFIDKSDTWLIDAQEFGKTPDVIKKLSDLIDVVFIGLHGSFGEDGKIQGMLDSVKISYTGSGKKTSEQAFDKEITQKLLHGKLMIPKWQVVGSTNETIDAQFPLVIKPVHEGSSVGVSIVRSIEDLPEAINLALRYDDKAMAQAYIDGVEVSCSVVEMPAPQALTPTELRPRHDDFFSYKAKYEAGATVELTPPELPTDTINKIQETALRAHNLLGCRGYSRTDMFVRGDDIYFLEINTLPGFTPTSILPQQAQHDGISYTKLIDILIEQARHD